MASTQKMSDSQMIFIGLLLLFIAGVARCGYLFVHTKITQRLVTIDQQKAEQQIRENAAFSDIPGFDKLQLVKEMELNNHQMPWSDHIKAVTEIFDAILSVDSAESYNIKLSDFQISLDEISLRGYVTNLRLLYNSPDPEKKTALIDRFEQLDFLSDISIKTYEKSAEGIGYEFDLTAKVTNDYAK
jgi:hypothetical protein